MNKKRLKQYHQFQHLGRQYVLNVAEMHAHAVDEAVARTLTRLTTAPAEPMDTLEEEQLATLGLLADGGPQKQKAAKRAPVPVVSATLFLTQSCNLKCTYCYGDEGKYGAGGKMTEQTAFRAVDWLIEQSGKMKQIHIGFFGGEPFLNFPLMQAVVAYALQKAQATGKKVGFHAVTNGTMLDDEKVAFIDKHKISIQISFDGPREVQDAQRPFANGKGSYDAIVPRIKKLLAVAPKTHGHAVLSGDTDPKTIMDGMRAIGFSEVTINPASASLFDGKAGDDAHGRDFETVIASLELEAAGWASGIGNRDDEALRVLKSNSQLRPALICLLHNAKRTHPCGAGMGLVAVSSAGDVYLCHRFVGMDDYKLGSVFQQELDRAEFGQSPLTANAACTDCYARYYCAGGCKHDNASSSGSVFTPPEDICRLRRRELELAATISAGLDPAGRAYLLAQDIVPPKPCPLDF